MNAFKPPNLVPLDGSSTLQVNGGMPGLADQQTPPSLSSYLKERRKRDWRCNSMIYLTVISTCSSVLALQPFNK